MPTHKLIPILIKIPDALKVLHMHTESEAYRWQYFVGLGIHVIPRQLYRSWTPSVTVKTL
jgi:hypothetical protein